MTCFEPSWLPLLRPVGAFRIPYLMEGNDFAVGSVGPEPLLVLSSPDEDMHQPAVTTENLLQLHSELLRTYHCVRAPLYSIATLDIHCSCIIDRHHWKGPLGYQPPAPPLSKLSKRPSSPQSHPLPFTQQHTAETRSTSKND